MPKQSYKHCCNLQIFGELEWEMHKFDLKTQELGHTFKAY